MPEPLDVVYFGSGAFGLPTLERLAQRHRVRAVVTQPDRPAGRGRELTPNPVAAWAARHLPDAQLVKPDRVNDPAATALVRAFPADAWVVIAFGQKLSPALLEGRWAINLHASLLPRWRGAAPIHHAVLAGDATTGNSVITLADRMDAGLVLAQSRRPIGPTQTTGELHDLLAADGPDLVEQVLADRAAGTLSPRAQDESLVTLAPKLSRDDARVDFSRPARDCRCLINGLSPWPGVSVRLAGVEARLLRAEDLPGAFPDAPPGTVADPATGLVSCGGSTRLRLRDLQPAGGRPMGWTDFARGRRINAGDRIEGWPGRAPT